MEVCSVDHGWNKPELGTLLVLVKCLVEVLLAIPEAFLEANSEVVQSSCTVFGFRSTSKAVDSSLQLLSDVEVVCSEEVDGVLTTELCCPLEHRQCLLTITAHKGIEYAGAFVLITTRFIDLTELGQRLWQSGRCGFFEQKESYFLIVWQ
jgi:hypothetical protein